MAKVINGDITSVQAMTELGLKKTSYYKLKKIFYENEGGK